MSNAAMNAIVLTAAGIAAAIIIDQYVGVSRML
jgi:hypothetical protein